MTATLKLVKPYRALVALLKSHKAAQFPLWSVVTVNAPQYHGPAIILNGDGEPPDQLACRLENGNTWWYSIECCEINLDTATWPRWIIEFSKSRGTQTSNLDREIYSQS